MVGQWVFAIVIALVFSPYAWEGRERAVHVHVWTAVLLGGAITGFPSRWRCCAPAAIADAARRRGAQMLWSALLIHLTGGRIETHFHVFGSLAFLAVLSRLAGAGPGDRGRGRRPPRPAALSGPSRSTAIVNPEWWRFLEHAFWVVFEDVFLVVQCLRGHARDAVDRGARSRARGARRKRVDEVLRARAARRGAGVRGRARPRLHPLMGGPTQNALGAPDSGFDTATLVVDGRESRWSAEQFRKMPLLDRIRCSPAVTSSSSGTGRASPGPGGALGP